MRASFSKEMGTYLESRNAPRQPPLGLYRRFHLFYIKAKRQVIEYLIHLKHLLVPKRVLHEMDGLNIHIFDREKSPVVEFLRNKFGKKKEKQRRPMSVDPMLVEKSIREGRVHHFNR